MIRNIFICQMRAGGCARDIQINFLNRIRWHVPVELDDSRLSTSNPKWFHHPPKIHFFLFVECSMLPNIMTCHISTIKICSLNRTLCAVFRLACSFRYSGGRDSIIQLYLKKRKENSRGRVAKSISDVIRKDADETLWLLTVKSGGLLSYTVYNNNSNVNKFNDYHRVFMYCVAQLTDAFVYSLWAWHEIRAIELCALQCCNLLCKRY